VSHEHADAGIGNYAGVDEQSGIYAGDGGFNINVKGNTDLKGAVIASDADASKNTLNTGTLTFSDIENHSDYSASSSGFSAGASIGAPAKGTGTSSGGNGGGLTPMLSQSDSGSSDATTRSAISAGSINIADKDHQTQDIANLSRDTVDANGTVSKLPDVKNLLDKQGDMMNAASAAGEAVATQIGAIADAKRDAAKKAAEQAASDGNAELAAQYKAEAASWDEGGTYRVAMHTAGGALIAGLGGGSALGGAAGAGISSALSGKLNLMADQLETGDGSGMDPGLTAGNFAGNLIAGGIGGLVGGNSGAFSAANMELYNANKDNGQGKGGTGSELADKGKAAANAVADWFKDTYGDIPGTLSRWAGQITGHMNADAQAKAGESPLALMAQGTANGLSAVAGAGGGKPPTANPGLVLVDSGGADCECVAGDAGVCAQ
jgi:filamentous hemagglutinin